MTWIEENPMNLQHLDFLNVPVSLVSTSFSDYKTPFLNNYRI